MRDRARRAAAEIRQLKEERAAAIALERLVATHGARPARESRSEPVERAAASFAP